MYDESPDPGDMLIDVSELSLCDLDKIEESSLARTLRLILDGRNDESEPVASFSSRI